MGNHQLAQFNIAKAKGPTDDPVMAGFMNNLDKINTLAEVSPGFVWRFQDETGSATEVKAFDDPSILLNLTIWESVEAFRDYVYKSDHASFMRRRREWFEPWNNGPVLVMWWIPEGTIPTIEESLKRLTMLEEKGSTREAFGFRETFDPPSS